MNTKQPVNLRKLQQPHTRQQIWISYKWPSLGEMHLAFYHTSFYQADKSFNSSLLEVIVSHSLVFGQEVYAFSQDNAGKKISEKNENSHTKVGVTHEVPGREKGIASSLCFIVHKSLSKAGTGGQLVIFHSIWGIFYWEFGNESSISWAGGCCSTLSTAVRKHEVVADTDWEGPLRSDDRTLIHKDNNGPGEV